MLIAARVIQGIGGGGLLNLPNIIIGDLFSPRRRGAYYGIIGSTWALASSLGPILGGVFTTKATWRWCFYVNLPLDGMAFIIILFFLDLTTPKTPLFEGLAAIDWLGAFFIIAGTLLFLFGLEFGGTSFPWNSVTVICLLVFGVVATILFIPVEAKIAKYPIMPGRIFKNRSNLASLGVCFFHALTFISGAYYLPLYFQAVRGNTPLLSGAYTLAYAASIGISSVSTGIYIRKTGLYLPPIFFGKFLYMPHFPIPSSYLFLCTRLIVRLP
jgi:MFS family permease